MLARSLVISTFGNLVGPASILVASSVVAQQAGPAGRGEVAAVNAVIVLIAAFAAFGLPEALTYFVARNGSGRGGFANRRAIWVTLLAGITSSGVVALLAPTLSGGNDYLAQVITIASITVLPSMLVSLLRASAAGHQRWGTIAAERTIAAIARVAGILIPVALGNFSILNASLALVGAPLLGAIAYLPYRRVATPGRQVTDVPFMSYAAKSWAGTLAGMLTARLSQAILLPLSDAHQLGLFAVAVNLSEVMLISNQAFRDVIYAAESKDSDVARLATASRVSTIIAIVSAVFIAGVSPILIPLMFGPEFGESIPLTIVLCLGIVLGVPGSVAGMGLGARGRPELRSGSLAVGLVFNVVLLISLVPSLGAWGAAIAAVVTTMVISNTNLIQLYRFFGYSPWQFALPRSSDFGELRRQLTKLLGRGGVGNA
ncbi:oligosaccharide flippase family protein [Salinibacterium sp. G-O1]|uniref:oligosaccharide flippase family protein n=1 Tax=Salinibacterium sp. G-O1 TaxID=3046208 RepID=UPI0024BB314F|nr:oligosaccharide flippase family protein [Salinibacterium sp. G-O1]MDJ0335415.1 oligosaccharide flippase family protein [Salinibacterium sp. G-O1]